MAMPPADGMAPQPFGLVLGLFWTPYADWIYTVVSISGLLLMVWLVLRLRSRLLRAHGLSHIRPNPCA